MSITLAPPETGPEESIVSVPQGITISAPKLKLICEFSFISINSFGIIQLSAVIKMTEYSPADKPEQTLPPIILLSICKVSPKLFIQK